MRRRHRYCGTHPDVKALVLIGLYSGTRAAAIAAASPHRSAGQSYVDLDNGIFYRLPEGQAATNKRQPPVPLLDRLLAHMRRWVDNGLVKDHFVEWHGSGVRSVKPAFKTAVKLAKLPGVEMLDRVYGHHHPDYLRKAARRLGYGRRRQSLAETLAGRRTRRPLSSQRAEIISGPGRTRTSNQTVMSGRL